MIVYCNVLSRGIKIKKKIKQKQIFIIYKKSDKLIILNQFSLKVYFKESTLDSTPKEFRYKTLVREKIPNEKEALIRNIWCLKYKKYILKNIRRKEE